MFTFVTFQAVASHWTQRQLFGLDYNFQHVLMVLAFPMQSDDGGGQVQKQEVYVELDMLMTREQLRSLKNR